MSNSGTRLFSLSSQKSNEIINKIHSLNPTAFFLDNKDRTALGQRLISTLVNLVTLSSLAHSTKLNNQIISLSTASTMLCSLVFTLLSYQQSTHPPTKNRGSLRRTPQPWSSSSLLRLVRVIQREADIIHREIENLDKKLSSFSYLSNPTHHICQLFEKSLLDHLHLLVDALSNLPLRNPRDIYISYDKAQLQLASMSTCILPEKNHEIPCLLTSRSYSKAESTGALKNENKNNSVGKRFIHTLSSFKNRPHSNSQEKEEVSSITEEKALDPGSDQCEMIPCDHKSNSIKQLLNNRLEKKQSSGHSLKELFHLSPNHKDVLENTGISKRRGSTNTFSFTGQNVSKGYPSKKLVLHTSYSSDTKLSASSWSIESGKGGVPYHSLFSFRSTSLLKYHKSKADHPLSSLPEASSSTTSESTSLARNLSFVLNNSLLLNNFTEEEENEKFDKEGNSVFLDALPIIASSSQISPDISKQDISPLSSPTQPEEQPSNSRTSYASYFSAISFSSLKSCFEEPQVIETGCNTIDKNIETLEERRRNSEKSIEKEANTNANTNTNINTSTNTCSTGLSSHTMSPKSSTTPVKNIGQNTPSTTSSPNSERKKEAAAYSKYQYDFLPPRVNQTQTYKKGSLYYISENGKDVLVLKKVDCKMHVVAGTVKKLLEKLADDTAQDLDYVDTLLMSYTYFTDSLTLLESLITRFHPPERPGRLSHVQKPSKCIQAKVLNVISRWAKLQCQDFKEITLRKQLLQFIENRVTQAGFSIEASLIQNLLDTQLEQHAHKRHSLVALSSYSQSYFSAWSMSMEENTYPPSPSSSIPSSSICRPPTVPNAMSFSSFNSNTPPASPTLISPVFGLNLVPGIMSLKAKDIAKYLTIADFYIFRCITAYEYMHGPWRDSPPEQEGVINTSDSISLITQRANMISHWVIHDICTCQSPKQQRNVIKHFIEVAKLCLEWNNFHTSMVITMGLLSTSVQRLQDIWQSLSHRDTHTFGLLQRNLDVGNNMAVYRQALEKIKPPIIPFFPLILKDITFFMEGNSTLLTQSEGLINFSKFRSLVQFLDIVLKYTSENYWFAGDLENLLFFPEALVHRVSRGAPLDSVAELVELRIQSVSKCYKDPQCGVLLV